MKKYFLSKLVVAALILSAALTGCSKDKKGKLSRLDIGNATAVLTASNGTKSLTKSTMESDMLLKITDSGVVETSFIDDEGNVINKTFWSVIHEIENHDYFVMKLWDISSTATSDKDFRYNDYLYLVRKKDGNIIAIEGIDVIDYHFLIRNRGTIIHDEKGNLYFESRDIDLFTPQRITKVEISGGSATVTHLPGTENAMLLTVSTKGDVYYIGSGNYTYVLTPNGRVHNLSELMTEELGYNISIWGGIWRGSGNEMRILTSSGSSDVHTVNIDNNGDISVDSSPRYYDFWINPNYIITFPNRVLLLDGNYSPTSGYELIVEVENPSNTPRAIKLNYNFPLSPGHAHAPEGSCSVRDVKNTDKHYYLHGTDGYYNYEEYKWVDGSSFLIKVNPTTDAVTELVAAGVYNIKHFTVSSNDEVTFNAVRKSDGVSILGKFTASGQFQLIEETNINVTEMISTR